MINLLLADDDPDDRLVFTEALEEIPLSIQLTTVSDGELLMAHLQELKSLPHVIFLDLNMPKKNGYECLVEIKQDNNFKELPVVVYSTSFDPEMTPVLHQHGAYFYIQKPREFAQLRKVVFHALKLITSPNFSRPGLEEFTLEA